MLLFLSFVVLAVILFQLGSYSVWVTVLSTIIKAIVFLAFGWVFVYLLYRWKKRKKIQSQVGVCNPPN